MGINGLDTPAQQPVSEYSYPPNMYEYLLVIL